MVGGNGGKSLTNWGRGVFRQVMKGLGLGCLGVYYTVYRGCYCINVLMMFYYLFSTCFSIVKGSGMGANCINSIKPFTFRALAIL